jgi:hypothetical protein
LARRNESGEIFGGDPLHTTREFSSNHVRHRQASVSGSAGGKVKRGGEAAGTKPERTMVADVKFESSRFKAVRADPYRRHFLLLLLILTLCNFAQRLHKTRDAFCQAWGVNG